MGRNLVAGLSIDGYHARYAILDVGSRSIDVEDLLDIDKETDDPFWYLDPLRQGNGLWKKVARLSLALGDSMALRYTFPLDAALTGPALSDHLRWELSQLDPSADAADIVNDIHPLHTLHDETVIETLLVAVRRSLLASISSTLAASDIALHKVDTRFFGGQYAMLTSYPDALSQTICLCAAGEETVDTGLLVEGRLIRYRSTAASDSESLPDAVIAAAGDLSPDRVFIWGAGITDRLLTGLQIRWSVPVIILDPFIRLNVPGKLRKKINQDIRGHLYSAAVGCALLR